MFVSETVTKIKISHISGKSSDLLPDFEGAPYEFWVGSNVPVGTSVGQIRVTEEFRPRKVSYDLLHSYHEGGM